MSGYIKLNVIGLTYSQTQSSAYALVLGEENGSRRIPIVIGAAEAQSIALYLQDLTPSRPLTHDIFVSLIDSYSIKLVSVTIYKFENEVFYSELLFKDKDGEFVKIDSRTSDAVALAVRSQCPILTTEEILEETGVFFDEEDMENEELDEEGDDLDQTDFENVEDEIQEQLDLFSVESLSDLNAEQLHMLLDEAIRQEDYEKAKSINEEIKNRKKKS